MAAIKISLIADVRSFISSFKRGTESVEDLVTEVKDLAEAGDDTAKSMVRDIDKIGDAAKKAGKQVESGLKEGFDEAGREAGQSGRESAASFSGGFEDVADFVQETLANALGGFGPLGAAAGTALAVALGAALAGASDAQEKLEAAREAAGDLAKTLYANNGQLPMADALDDLLGMLTKERSGNVVENWVNDWFDLGTNIDAVRAASSKAGIPTATLMRALSGSDLDAIGPAIRDIQAAIDAIDVGPMDLEGLGEQTQLGSVITQLEIVRDRAGLAKDALSLTTEQQNAVDYANRVAEIGSAWQNAATDASDYWTANEEGVASFDWQGYLRDAEYVAQQSNEFKRQIVTLPPEIAEEANRVFAASGATAGVAYITAFQTASAPDQARFSEVARANGEAAGIAGAQGIVKGFGDPKLKTTIETDDKPAKTAWEMFTTSVGTKKPKSILEVDTKPADAAVKSTKTEAGKSVTFPLNARAQVDWTAVTRSPPTVYIPGVIVKPGTRQPL